ncbi:LysR family transcriptional regulator [Pilimelia anulata]|uniref:LysR family transcriptional regulator n=1 Tax=Pilimelia anulata TaxID=53371 RepID=A0A8J3B417_9ACTN|nr:LysR family transcriptional regulator [Pilimelia anulata]GGJ94118.1 LysR family transcriptional regulator [Pilimelia anulata]
MELEFRHLRLVRAIVDTGSLSAAATALGMTQPSATEALGRAERLAGGRLFHRGAAGAAATRLGELVATHALTVLEALERFDSTAAAYRAPDSMPTIRFGCTPGAHAASLSLISMRVVSASVDVRIGVDGSSWLDLLADRRIDAALIVEFPGAEYPVPPGVQRVVVAVEPLFVGLPAGHRCAERAEVDLAELAGETYCMIRSPRPDLAVHLIGACRRAGYTPRISDLEFAETLPMVQRGRGVLVMMASSRPPAGLSIVPLARAPLRMRTSLYWQTDGPLRPGDVHRLWTELVTNQRATVDERPAYRAWRDRHPEWRATPPRPVESYDPCA